MGSARAQGQQRGRPARAEQLEVLALFEGLAAAELAALAAASATRTYRRGDVVWRAGDAGEELLVILSGGLDVWGGSSAVPLARLGPGDYAGELSLLLDEPRSATVTCARAAEVLTVPKDAFREVVRADPQVLGRLTDLVSRRAMSLARGDAPPRPTTVVGVVAAGDARGTTLVATAVADLAAGMVATLLVRFGDGEVDDAPNHIAPGRANRATLAIDPTGRGGARQLVAAVERIVTKADADRPRLIVLDLPRGDAAAAAAGAACDAVVVVTSRTTEATDLPPTTGARAVHQVVNRHPQRHAGAGPLNHCEPFFLHHEPLVRGLGADEAAATLLTHLDSPMARTLGRLARKLLGVSVGLALGGGAAFGIAHVGILLALEEAGLPVDLVAGTSMGSIIAIAHAAGLSGEEMAAIAARIGNVRTTMSVLDPTFSGAGLLNGRRLVSIFAPLLPNETFDDLVTPCRVVAMDVETGERVDIGSGRLDHAFRASCSIPLVFTPVKDGERTLVDGGMIDPVPVDVARDMGADVVVGVNVVPKLERGVTTALSRTFKQINRLNPLARFGGGRDLPDLVDVLMNSLQVVEYELGSYKQQAADVQVEVSLAEFTWIEFYRATEIIARGREAGRAAVEGLRAELDRRLSPEPTPAATRARSAPTQPAPRRRAAGPGTT